MSDDYVYGLGLACGLPVLLLFGMVVRAFFTPRERAARALKGAATTAFGELREGAEAKVVGAVQCDEPMRAPATGRACAAYEVTLHFKPPGRSREPHRRGAMRPFRLEDEAGSIGVDTEGAVLVLEQDYVTTIDAADADDWVIELLQEFGVTFASRDLASGPVEIREAAAEIGERVAVLGTLQNGRLVAGEGPVRISDVASARGDTDRAHQG